MFAAILLTVAALTPLISVRPVQAITSCSDYDYAQEFTAYAAGAYNPSTACRPGQVPHYYGWVGINGQIITPSSFPYLAGCDCNHSVGWLDVSFSVCGTCQGNWIQIGWLAGCNPQFCAGGQIKLYEEDQITVNGVTTLKERDEGYLNYATADIYSIEYYGNGNWEVFDHYNNMLVSLTGRPGSGTMVAGAEVCCGYNIQMPWQYLGYGTRGTNNTLRIKGANGYVDWTSSLSTGGTATWDEWICPNATYCPNTSPYFLTIWNADYYISPNGAN